MAAARAHLCALGLVLFASASWALDVAVLAPEADAPRPRAEGAAPCEAGAAPCDVTARSAPEICRAIETAAGRHALDPHFFARLIWRESLFDAGAVSPAGAEGIAQFMPGTAALRGLGDAFDPSQALEASAAYLAELTRDYGNIGLAAAAYNGGEARVTRFVAKEGGLALETRAYVHAVTGRSAQAWRDAPPEAVDLALSPAPFQQGCVALAATRGSGAPLASPPPPWGVIVASHREPEGAERSMERLRNRFADLLAGEPVAYVRSRMPGTARRLYHAQVGRRSRVEADALCARLRAAGADCMVLKN